MHKDNKACAYVPKEIKSSTEEEAVVGKTSPISPLVGLSRGDNVGVWTVDTSYAAGTLGGARCKHQILRHDTEEIAQ